MMKRPAWARSQGIPDRTAYRWHRAGTIPVRCCQAPSGTIIVDLEGTAAGDKQAAVPAMQGGVALYPRVAAYDQHDELERQLARPRKYAKAAGLQVTGAVKEISAGVAGHRKQRASLLSDPDVTTIVVEHRDPLMRFGADYVEAALAASGRRLVVVDDAEMKDDPVEDMIDVMTGFCARLYGRWSAGRRALAGVSAMESPDHDHRADTMQKRSCRKRAKPFHWHAVVTARLASIIRPAERSENRRTLRHPARNFVASRRGRAGRPLLPGMDTFGQSTSPCRSARSRGSRRPANT